MRKMLRVSPLAACVVVSTAAAQQGGWRIESSNIVSLAQPTTTIEVWAWFDDPSGWRDSFARGDFNLLAGDGGFSNPRQRLSLLYSAGEPRGNFVTGVEVGQVWGFAGVFAISDNPVLVWSADWTATSFQPRTVQLGTFDTTIFQIGTNSTHSGMNLLELYPQGFTPGTGVIEVVPSPASAVPMVVAGAVMLRRRR